MAPAAIGMKAMAVGLLSMALENLLFAIAILALANWDDRDGQSCLF
jgi:hypothetical protein